jgi:hypothetical protein
MLHYRAARPSTRGRRGKGEGSIYYQESRQCWAASLSLEGGKRKVIYGRTRKEVPASSRLHCETFSKVCSSPPWTALDDRPVCELSMREPWRPACARTVLGRSMALCSPMP